ncbi:MAG: iron-containing alcohol dehydrogenase [Candidatus Izemoplasma sp.]
MYKLYCRIYQSMFKLVANFLPFREPILLEGEGAILELPKQIKNNNINNVLIVTDSVLINLGLLDGLFKSLKTEEIQYTVYDKTIPNPTIDNIEEALLMYKENNCQGIVAFGGGSPIDCAKGVAARVARPKKQISKMQGVLKVLKKTPLLFAVPTTAGTGSEATIAAVISNAVTHEKYAINDPVLIPSYAVLDPLLTIGLPKHITSTTGMDALTHAVEAYIGRSNTKATIIQSENAVKLIFDNLETAFNDGSNIEARTNMLKASYYAGLSFTRAYIGYVHAVAHTLGGFYSIPHGHANAVILPYVLDYYGECVYEPLAKLADIVNLAENQSKQIKAEAFITAIKDLNKRMNIPTKISGIKEEDIPLMVKRAYKESNPLYPVPRIFSKQDLTNIYNMIKE